MPEKLILAKKRVCIFCFYENEGQVFGYVIKLLLDIKKITNRIIFIANGKLDAIGEKNVRKVTDEIYCRENIGLDYGAYSYALRNILSEEISNYDEMILCNNSFFGFFEKLESIFSKMEEKKFDVWGINMVNRGLLNSIQSYFLVLRTDYRLVKYFEKEIDDNDYGRTCALMESGFWEYLENNEFTFGSAFNTNNFCVYEAPKICIEKYNLPILKKKSLARCDSSQIDEIIKLLEKRNTYEVDLIQEYRNRTNCYSNTSSNDLRKLRNANISFDDLTKWIGRNTFFILGSGNIGHELYYAYFEGDCRFEGYIDTKDLENASMKQKVLNKKIVVAVKQETQKEIVQYLKGKNIEYMPIWHERD